MRSLVAPVDPVMLSGHGVVLREWRQDDAPLMVQLFDDPEIRRWTPMPDPFDAAAADSYLHRARAARRGRHRLQLAITLDGGPPCGEVLLFGLEPTRRQAELGYVLGATYRGRGLATAALTLLVGYAQESLLLHRLVLRIDPDNTASRAVACRAGFTLTNEPAMAQTVPGGRANLQTWELLTRA